MAKEWRNIPLCLYDSSPDTSPGTTEDFFCEIIQIRDNGFHSAIMQKCNYAFLIGTTVLYNVTNNVKGLHV